MFSLSALATFRGQNGSKSIKHLCWSSSGEEHQRFSAFILKHVYLLSVEPVLLPAGRRPAAHTRTQRPPKNTISQPLSLRSEGLKEPTRSRRGAGARCKGEVGGLHGRRWGEVQEERGGGGAISCQRRTGENRQADYRTIHPSAVTAA